MLLPYGASPTVCSFRSFIFSSSHPHRCVALASIPCCCSQGPHLQSHRWPPSHHLGSAHQHEGAVSGIQWMKVDGLLFFSIRHFANFNSPYSVQRLITRAKIDEVFLFDDSCQEVYWRAYTLVDGWLGHSPRAIKCLCVYG